MTSQGKTHWNPRGLDSFWKDPSKTVNWNLRGVFSDGMPHSNQIYLMTLRSRQLTQASFLQKNQTLQNVFFYICNGEMAQSISSLQNSEFLKLIISLFHYFLPKLRSVAQNEWKKHPYIFFLLLIQK